MSTEHVFEQHGALIAQLRAGRLEAPETLHERVLAAAPGTKRQRVRMSRRRKLVLLVPIAAGLAVGAALVQGAFFAGNTPLAAHGSLAEPLAKVRTFGPQRAAANPVHGRAQRGSLSWSAKTAEKKVEFPQGSPGTQLKVTNGTALTGAYYSADAIQSASGSGDLAATGAIPGAAVTIPSNRKVHADASLQVVVPSHAALTRATNKASQIVAGFGGYAQSVQYQASRSGDGNAFLDLRVPVGNAQAAIGKLAELGKLLSQQVATIDLQQQFTKQTDTIGRLKRAIAIYQQALNSGTLSGSQRVEVQIRLANAEHALTAQQKARGRTVSSAATADIQLQLTTNQHAFAVGQQGSGRLGRLLGNAADFLGLEGIIVLYALIVAGPIALLLWLGWAVRRERRRRDEKQLLAST